MNVDVGVIATRPAPCASDANIARQLRSAAQLPPGAELVAALAAVDVVRLDAGDRIAYLALMQTAHNWLTGSLTVAVAAAAGPLHQDAARPSPDPRSPTGDMHEDLICAEIGAALHSTPGATAALIKRARAAVGPLRVINERVLAGEWGDVHLRRALDATVDAPQELAARAAAHVSGRLRRPQRCSPNTLRNRLQRELAAIAPEIVTQQVKAKRRNRGVELHTDGDFRGWLGFDGSWPAVSWTYEQLSAWSEDRLALLKELRKAYPDVLLCCTDAVNVALATLGSPDLRPPAGAGAGAPAGVGVGVGTGAGALLLSECRWCGATDTRLPTLSQLRADALLDAVRAWSGRSMRCGGDTSAQPQAPREPRRGRRWRHAIVVCDVATALGLADNPGWVPGYGHVPAGLARELAAQASHWRRFLLDHDQQLVDVGRHSYQPSEALREMVTARDQTCTFPGCARPATDADLDHRTNFDGTNTMATNLHPLCRTHHRMKTHGGWNVEVGSGGLHTWTSPLGFQYSSRVVPPWLDP